MKRLLQRHDRPAALFCYNDCMAMGAYEAAAELRIEMPGELSVVGFDDQEIVAEGLCPPLMTAPVLLPCPLIRRDSVHVAPVGRLIGQLLPESPVAASIRRGRPHRQLTRDSR